MRKKKNLTERLEQVGNILLMPTTENLNFNIGQDNCCDFFDLNRIFKNDNPVVLEIGCGKGGFCTALAKKQPDVNILAVEKLANVIVGACEMAKGEYLKNLCFLLSAAEYLPRYIKKGSIEKIYLNFSCPYPKESYESHRLTAPRFLDIYKNLLSKNGEIIQKTDNKAFFEYSIKSFSQSGLVISDISLDLHGSKYAEDNIITEYESRFLAQEFPIFYMKTSVGGK